jgi:hypothetical protein
MAEHWNGGTGGKGSKPRPFAVPLEDFANSHNRIFGDKSAEKEAKQKEKEEYFARLAAETKARLEGNTGVDKNEYQDVLATEDCFDVESPDPALRSWYYDSHGIKRKKK